MSIYDEIDPLAYAELYQSIYPDGRVSRSYWT